MKKILNEPRFFQNKLALQRAFKTDETREKGLLTLIKERDPSIMSTIPPSQPG